MLCIFYFSGQISPPGSYGQLIPSHHTPVVVHDTLHSAVPPMLPPHLLNVILNKEAIDQVFLYAKYDFLLVHLII